MKKKTTVVLQHRCAVVVQDLHFYSLPRYLRRIDTAQETENSLQKVLPPAQQTCIINTHNSLEFIRACEDFCCNHDKSTPHRSERKNAENTVRRVKEGTCALLVQSGLAEKAVERSNGMLSILAKWQTESHVVNEDVAVNVMVQEIPLGA